MKQADDDINDIVEQVSHFGISLIFIGFLGEESSSLRIFVVG